LQQKLYQKTVQITLLMLVVDIFSRFDGNPGTAYSAINHTANFLIFLLSPLVPSLWLLYVHFHVFHEEKKMRQLLPPLTVVNIGNAAMLVCSQSRGWYYTIDSDNIYHRGPLFWLPVSMIVALVMTAFAIIVTNRKNIDRKHFFALVFFPVPPLVCVILQVAFLGTSLVLNGLTLSLVIIFFSIQNHSMNIDYLTGAYNRRSLEIHMQERVNASTESRTFSAILIDLDDFKFINDTFGHNTGDSVLETAVKILKSCLGPSDFIARFGGDEFCIILDVSNRADLETVVCRIQHCIGNYNKRAKNPYQLAWSMGYAVYDSHSHMKVEEFQKQIDKLMYENKKAKKRQSAT
jgi:diguanylate cyclase (GGDEF)-like protein